MTVNAIRAIFWGLVRIFFTEDAVWLVTASTSPGPISPLLPRLSR